MSNINEVSSLAAFINAHNKELQKFVTNYIYLNTGFSSDKCKLHSLVSESFIELFAKEARNKPIVIFKRILDVWFKEHPFSITTEGIIVLTQALNSAVEEFGIDPADKDKINDELNTMSEILQYILMASDIRIPEEKIEKESRALIEVSEILITHSDYEGVVHCLRKIEELFSFKRSSYYSFVPDSLEIVGVFGEEMNLINKLKRPLNSQKLFVQTYKTKKALYIRDSRQYFEEYLVELFQLVSLVIVPVFYKDRMYGWLVLDNIGEEFHPSLESMDALEEIGKLMGMYIHKIAFHEYRKESVTLTNRELEILNLLGEGADNKGIGHDLYLSEHTVRDYVSQLMLKLNAKNRTHLVAIAIRKGLI